MSASRTDMMPAAREGCCRISYWVLVPEVGTDDVVSALRASWLRSLHASEVHYCVANDSISRDDSLHRLPVWRSSTTPNSRDEFFGNGRLFDSKKREVYNSFLRRKVFAVLQDMSAVAARGALDYGMLLDSDTAINITTVIANVAIIAVAVAIGVGVTTSILVELCIITTFE